MISDSVITEVILRIVILACMVSLVLRLYEFCNDSDRCFKRVGRISCLERSSISL